jgi:hypothetical protein
MKIVPQSDPSGDINEHTSPVMKQNTPPDEGEGKNNPSPPNEAVVASKRKVPDNDGGAMKVPRRSSTMLVKDAASDGADVVMKVPRRSGIFQR